MTFKPALWRPIAGVLSVLNVAAAGFAAGSAEPFHAAVHVGLALGFGYWTQRLGRDPLGSELPARLEALEVEASDIRRELSEAQERLDFAERLLVQGRESGQLGPER